MQTQAYRDFVRYQSDLVKAMIREQQLNLNALQYFQERSRRSGRQASPGAP